MTQSLFGGGGFSGPIRSKLSTSSSGSSDTVSVSVALWAKKPPPPTPPTPPQPKATVQTTALNSDQAPDNSKKPKVDLGAAQKVATAGDTVPLVFCKRANGVGGAWVSPQLTKTGVNNFVGAFLYPVSQGQIVSSPQKTLAWNGTQCVAFRSDATNITLTHYYSTSAALAAAPNSCPITSGSNTSSGTYLFCDFDVFSYLEPILGPNGGTERELDVGGKYIFTNEITRGSGDLTNTVLKIPVTNFSVFEAISGSNVTTAYWAAIGFSPPPTTGEFVLSGTSAVYNGLVYVSGGKAAGTITRSPSSGYSSISSPYTNIIGGSEPLVYVYSGGTIDNQADLAYRTARGETSTPTDTTLDGIQDEEHVSIYADPTSPPTSANFQSYADITFLEIQGNIYDNPANGTYPTTTRQLNIFYEQGVSVDLFSQAKVGGVYQTGASNQFIDLAMHFFKLLRRVDGATTADIATPIDTSNLITLASFCTNNSTFFNGVIDKQTNAIEYLSRSAPFFLLRFISSNGRYSFQPILPITTGQQIDTTALTPAATFTDADILPGSFSKTYAEAEQRREFIASLLWRETNNAEIGQATTTTVRLSTTAVDAPFEQYDLSDCCTSAAHATLFGKYQLAFRKHVTHSISFAISLDTTGLIPTQIIKLQRSRVSSVGDNRTETEHYQIERISHSTDGVTTIQANHHPLTAGNVSEIANEVVNGTFTVK